MIRIKKNKIFFIAELSANHNGNLIHAKKLIKCAKANGASAIKLQTYTADSMTFNSKKEIFKIKRGLWKGYKLWDLYNKAKTPYEWHPKLFKYAKKLKIPIFSTPFDVHAVDFLEKLKCPFYKVASFEMTDLELIKKIAKTRKPIIISTGLSNLKEIKLAYDTAKKYGSSQIILLYCVSNYPSDIKDFNVNNIEILKKKFNCEIGLSDHSKGSFVGICSVTSGVNVVEKHIGLDGQKNGLDIEFSLRGKEIKNYINDLNNTKEIFKRKKFFRSKNELKNSIFKRSIFVSKKINKGDKFSKENLITKRPGFGVSPIYFSKLIGKRAKKNYHYSDFISKKELL